MPKQRALAPALAVVFSLGCVVPVLARDPAARIDASKRSRVSTEEQALDPEVRPMERADGVQDRRFDRGELLDQPDAPVGDRRADIDLQESREKTLIEPELKTYERLDYDPSRYDGQRSDRFRTGDDIYRTSMAQRYQNSLGEAQDAAPKTVVKKRTTFDSVNRFIFRRNRPEGDELFGSAGAAPGPGAGPPAPATNVNT
ncbi:MAG: hypothetical protein ABII82_20930, partial [Verrucomicrobiota bacterium]